MPPLPRALTIAGSDSGGGAGVQADLKTFTVFRVYGMSAITALTAQNTTGVTGIHPVPPQFVRDQIDAVASDIGIDAAKTGMLATPDIIRYVAAAVRKWSIAPLVVDPVLIAESGASLATDGAAVTLLSDLIPLATVVTPNVLEAEHLTGVRIRSIEDARWAARTLVQRGARAVLLKGGHLAGAEAVDLFDDGHTTREFTSPRLSAPNTHGTGCQLSAAITAGLAAGLPLLDAIAQGKRFITIAIRNGLAIGHGHGPANPLAWLTH